MNKLGLWLWCFPQMFVGLLVRIFTRARNVGNYYQYIVPFGSVSLGEYIFLCPSHWGQGDVLKHEQGHQKQSRILGWLYLFIIGIPSIVWAGCFKEYRKKHNISYYSFYTEKWADKLAGITRT